MAKKKRCGSPKCVSCRWWPRIAKMLGEDQGCYWVDRDTGELFIATGLRALPSGDYTEITGGMDFYEVRCECGAKGPARQDLLEKGVIDRCPSCAATSAQAIRN